MGSAWSDLAGLNKVAEGGAGDVQYLDDRGLGDILAQQRPNVLLLAVESGCSQTPLVRPSSFLLLTGLRDRALIALMIYTFARVGAVVKMRAEDVFVQGRRTWVRLREKGGKHHEMPCHHKLESYLQDYAAARPSSLPPDPKAWLFPTARGPSGRLSNRPMAQADVYRMI